MALSLYCASRDASVWSSAFHAEGDHRCPRCEEPLGPGPDAEADRTVAESDEVEA